MSQRRLVALAIFACASGLASQAFGQDDPRLALIGSFDSSPTIGFQWDINDRLAVRVDGSYSFRDEFTEYESGRFTFTGSIPIVSTSRVETTSHGGAIGLAGIVTMRRTDRMRLYFAPRIAIAFSQQRISETAAPTSTSVHVYADGTTSQVIFGLPSSEPETVETSYTTPSAGISFGAVANVFERVALFGEAGVSYSRSNTPSGTTSASSLTLIAATETRRTTFGTRGAVGIMFRF